VRSFFSEKFVKKGWDCMKFPLVPLLLTGQSISSEARQALRENRLKDAAEILMEQYGLNCAEAGDLLDVSACEE
jgi:hypothetical protein